MGLTTLSSREFNQGASRAKKAAADGPVFITDRGRRTHVLLTIEDYHKLVGKGKNIVDLLSAPGLADIDFEPERARDTLRGPVDLF